MDELIGRIVAGAGVDRETAEKALAVILAFLLREGPAEKVQSLLARMPGAEALAQQGSGSLGMGGVMGAGAALMGLGLGMPQVQNVTRIVMAHARETAGEDAVGEIVGAIPGLSQFI